MKAYVKPELFFESYELSQHVAACGWDLNHGDSTSCNAIWDPTLNNDDLFGVYLFNSDNCNATPDKREDFCYTNGVQGNNLFRS